MTSRGVFCILLTTQHCNNFMILLQLNGKRVFVASTNFTSDSLLEQSRIHTTVEANRFFRIKERDSLCTNLTGKDLLPPKNKEVQNLMNSSVQERTIPSSKYRLVIRAALSVFLCEAFVMIIVSRENACRGTWRDFLASGFVWHNHGQEMQS